MLTNIEIENLKKIQENVSVFAKNITEIQAKMDQIDEEYRKKAEKKKADLQNSLENCQKEVNFWEQLVSAQYHKTISELLSPSLSEEDASNTTVEQAAEDEDVVVDTTVEAPADFTEENTTADAAPEFDGAGFTETDNVVTEDMAQDASAPEDSLFSETNDTVPAEETEQEPAMEENSFEGFDSESVPTVSDDGFPSLEDLPEEWR